MARMPSAGRTIAILLAIILAGVATFAIYRYIDGLRDEAFAGAELVEIFRAAGTIQAGTAATAAIDQGLIEPGEVPRETLPDNAITSLDQIRGLVAIDRVLPGEIIQQGRFGDPATAAVSGFEIPEGLQAMSLQVGVVPGVAGYIRPGDRISVIAHIAAPGPEEVIIGPDGLPLEIGDAPVETRAQFLVQDIEVLAVGRRVVVTGQQGQEQDQIQQTENVLVTVAITDQQAERLVFATNEGSLYFTLLAEDYSPQNTPGRTFDNLFAPQ